VQVGSLELRTIVSDQESKIQQFEELLTQLAGDRAKIIFDRNKEHTGSDVVALIEPVNPRAAKIDARLELDFGVYLQLGRASPFEIPFWGGYYTHDPWWRELDAFCTAVMKGKFQEELMMVGGKITRSDHELILPGGKKIKERWRKLFPFWGKRVCITMHYEPY
jgi:hypothetical protein